MRRCRWGPSACAALLIAALAAPAVAQPAGSRDALVAQLRHDEELLLEVEVNGVRVAEATLMLRTTDGRFHATLESLRTWRLRAPAGGATLRGGIAWVPLAALPGVSVRFDAARQRLSISAPADAFEASAVPAPQPRRHEPTEPRPGGFLNYSLVGTRGSGTTSYAGQLEAGVFSRQGVVVAGLLAQHNPRERGVVRLDTTYTRDFPGRLESLRIGDTVTGGGAWGRPQRIGGVQWGTNFSLQPGFVSFPTFTARGETALPSTVDVFVNNAMVAQQPVPPGPFSITNIPTISGAGDVQLVVRDLLGREVLITQPFYGSSDLLLKGLSQYSVEAGFERESFGTESFGYGDPVASATWRHGVTDRLTAEVHGEAGRRVVAVGGGLDMLVPSAGVLSATLAASEARDAGTGVLAGFAYSHQARDLGFTFRSRWTNASWRQTGVTEFSPVAKLEVAASASVSLRRFGSLNAAYVDQRFRERADNRFATVGWNVPLVRGAVLGVMALRSFGDRSTTLSVTLTAPFGPHESASVAQFVQRGGSSGDGEFTQLNVQRSLPVGEGWGYRVVARSETDVQAGASLQTAFGTYGAEATRFEGSNGIRLSASGGVGMLGGHVFASREITESFGVVKVDDYDGVGILLDNQPAARTARGGYAVLPRLRAYDINQVGIAQVDLPLDASIERLKVEAVPYFRSGVYVEFPVRRSHGATLRIVLDDGVPIPAGATVAIEGRSETFPIGQNGETYVTGLARENRLLVRWRASSCAIGVPFPARKDPLPDLGTFVCSGVAR